METSTSNLIANNRRKITKNIKIIDPIHDSRWDEFVHSHRFGSIYHLSSWSEVLKKTFDYKPYYLILEEDGKIKAVSQNVNRKA